MAFAPSLRPLTSLCRQCKSRIEQRLVRANFTTTSQGRVAFLKNVSGQREVDEVLKDPAKDPPRWARTPTAMRAPHKTRPANENDDYPVNEDPQRLDMVYTKMLGQGGERLLPDAVKWLAVTHKSFDHGRRGFNDRLAFMGKRIVDLQTSLALLQSTPSPEIAQAGNDKFGRTPWQPDSIKNIENVSQFAKDRILGLAPLARLAERYGLDGVIRWKPRQIKNLRVSGLDAVLAHTMYAIVGAVALQQGGEVAGKTVRHRILNPLGII